MIETDPQTENDLREAVRLATSYATDFLRAENVKGFGNIPSEQFVVRCHEGFDIAQKLILKNILTLEKRLKELRTDFQERSKEKKKRKFSAMTSSGNFARRRTGLSASRMRFDASPTPWCGRYSA
jgi:hypothetical protein